MVRLAAALLPALVPAMAGSKLYTEAVSCLNAGADRGKREFRRHMAAGHEHAPRRFGPQIAEIVALPGVVVR